MNTIQSFSNDEFGKIRIIMIDNEPWFAGKDISNVLGYERETKAITDHVDEDDRKMMDGKTQSQFGLELGQRGGWLINESGLYSLILSSKLPSTKKFKKWVTSEVLPSIRKNGGYIAKQEQLTPEQIVANALIVAQNIISNKDKQIKEMQPKADYFDELVERKLLTNFRDTAFELGIKQNAFVNWLLEHKYIYRDNKGGLKPYSTPKTDGLFEEKEYKSNRSEHAGLQTLITPKGRETFRLLLGAERE